MTRINGLPTYAYKYEFIVVRCWDDEYWFYGAYDDEVRAWMVAEAINGDVFYND